MFSSGLKGGDLGSLGLSRIEQKSLYAAGVFFVLAIVFSAFTIASATLTVVLLAGATLFVAGLFGCLFGIFFRARG